MAQITLQQFRQRYPQYQGKSDDELAEALHRKFYSTIPREEFNARLGLAAPGNVSTITLEFNDALAAGSARSQVFDGYQPEVYAQPNSDLPVPRPGVSGPSQNIVQTGMLENVGAGIDNGANAILGAPVDLPVWLGNSVINAGNSGIEMAGGGRPVPNIPVDLPGSRLGWEQTQEGLGFTPPSSVVPANQAEALARAAAEAAAMSVIPETLMMKGGQIMKAASPAIAGGMDMLSSIFGQSRTTGQFARNTATNAAAGAGSVAAMDAAPDGWEPIAGLAGGLTAAGLTHAATGIPGAARQVVDTVGNYLAPFTRGGQEQLAGQTIRDAATSPGAVQDALGGMPQEIVAGSKPTTFQQTGDMGLGALERGVATQNPADFMQRRTDQNTARTAAMESIAPVGSPERVVTTVRGYIDDLDQQINASIEAASVRAQNANQAIGTGVLPEAVGASIREALETARSQAKTQERAMWNAVDPDGTMVLGAGSTRTGAQQITQNMPVSAKPMSGEEAAIFAVARTTGDNMQFSEMTALQSRLKAEMRAERIANGESPAYVRLSQLNGAIQKDLETAIAAKVQQEAQAVQAGRMQFEDTVAAKLRSEAEAFFGARQAQTGSIGGEGPGGHRGSGPTSFSGVRGAEVSQGRGFGDGASDPRLSTDASPSSFDRAALERLTAARGATRQRVETFDNPTLAPIRKRPSTVSPYDMPAGAVPGRIFFPGPKSPEAIIKFREAVGDAQAGPMLASYAIDRLRKAAIRQDGTLDPAKATAWLRQHADALRAFPELRQAIEQASQSSDTMAAVARAERQRLDDAQKGLVGRLLGTSDPDQVVQVIGSALARGDAAQVIARLREALGDNPDALQGLRKAVAQFITERFVSNTEAGTSGMGTIKADQFQSFVRQKRGALHAAGFTETEMNLLEDIAKDLQQANRSIAAVRLPGGSNTAQDALAARAGDGAATILAKLLTTAAVSGGGVSLFGGPWIGIPVGIATALGGAFRQVGLQRVDELVKEAMLNPSLARTLLQKVGSPKAKAQTIDIKQMLRRAMTISQSQVGPEQNKKRSGHEMVMDALLQKPASTKPGSHQAIVQALIGQGSQEGPAHVW